MVNYFVYSVRSLGLIFGLSNNERKGTKKYAHTQVSEYIFLKKIDSIYRIITLPLTRGLLISGQ